MLVSLPGDWVIFATSMGFKSQNRKFRTVVTCYSVHKICYANFNEFKESLTDFSDQLARLKELVIENVDNLLRQKLSKPRF